MKVLIITMALLTMFLGCGGDESVADTTTGATDVAAIQTADRISVTGE